ncbi:hypothetical protein FOZ60_001257, partial [Perkinsus olseni]
ASFRSMSCTLPESDSFEVPHSAIPGVSGPVYRHPGYKNRLQRFIDDDSSIVTSFDVFKRTVEKYPDRPCHGTRPVLDDGSVGPFEWQTYKEVYERIINFGRGLEELNLLSKSEDGSMRLIGIYMKNRSESRTLSKSKEGVPACAL